MAFDDSPFFIENGILYICLRKGTYDKFTNEILVQKMLCDLMVQFKLLEKSKKWMELVKRFLSIKPPNGIKNRINELIWDKAINGTVIDVTYFYVYSIRISSKFVCSQLYLADISLKHVLFHDDMKKMLEKYESYCEPFKNNDNSEQEDTWIRLYSTNEENLINAFLEMSVRLDYQLINFKLMPYDSAFDIMAEYVAEGVIDKMDFI